jgi:hypothetical protein
MKKKKTSELITGLLAGMLLVLFMLNIINYKNGSIAAFGVPIALSTIVFVNFGNIQKIKKELRSRETQL